MNNNEFPVAKFVIGGIAAFIVLIVIIAVFPVVVVPAGQRGVVFNNISGVESRILGEGTHFRTPFVESVINMPIQTQATTFQETGPNSAGTQDSQRVNLDVTINWHLNPAKVNWIYQHIGNIDAVSNNVLANNVRDSIKAAVSKYAALDVQKNRDNVAASASEVLQKKMEKYYVVIDDLSITNIDFSEQFNAAVEDAQVQQQKAKAAQYSVQTAKANADSAVATAQGQAQAQALLQQNLTPELLEKMWIDKWNGQLPSTNLGSNEPLPVFNISK